MQIKEKPHKKQKFGFWMRRFKGFPLIELDSGYKRHFRTNELYSAAREAIAKSTFSGPLDMRQFVSRLINGFEQDYTTVPMGEDIELPNGIFVPAFNADYMDS